MKYIRTKDGIFDIDNYLIENATKKCFHGIIVGSYEDFEDIEIIKQADTIEELCDEFVCQRMIFRKLEDVETHLRSANEWCNFNIYGAIWTDKGLIYVAKLNDKGEMELL